MNTSAGADFIGRWVYPDTKPNRRAGLVRVAHIEEPSGGDGGAAAQAGYIDLGRERLSFTGPLRRLSADRLGWTGEEGDHSLQLAPRASALVMDAQLHLGGHALHLGASRTAWLMESRPEIGPDGDVRLTVRRQAWPRWSRRLHLDDGAIATRNRYGALKLSKPSRRSFELTGPRLDLLVEGHVDRKMAIVTCNGEVLATELVKVVRDGDLPTLFIGAYRLRLPSDTNLEPGGLCWTASGNNYHLGLLPLAEVVELNYLGKEACLAVNDFVFIAKIVDVEDRPDGGAEMTVLDGSVKLVIQLPASTSLLPQCMVWRNGDQTGYLSLVRPVQCGAE